MNILVGCNINNPLIMLAAQANMSLDNKVAPKLTPTWVSEDAYNNIGNLTEQFDRTKSHRYVITLNADIKEARIYRWRIHKCKNICATYKRCQIEILQQISNDQIQMNSRVDIIEKQLNK